MEALVRMMNALDYMETKMEERLDMDEIAKTAYVSPFHFQRMFHILTGMTVAEYVRKRKLTLAAQELASSSVKVLDVALKYGYDSPESFSKAFRRIHGISPSEARLPGVSLKAFPRLSFHLSLKGDQDMDYRIEDKEAFTIVGKSLAVSCKDGENHREIPKFWGRCHDDGTVAALETMAPGELALGVCLDMNVETGDFTYMIAVKSDSDKASGELVAREVPASTWAIFTSIGPLPDSIQTLFGRIFSEWFPATGYEHAGGPEIEAYTVGDTCADDYRCEVWIPIMKK
ncbi:GyrI-like domain-containing protein [Paenibacillus sp. LHD-117]|uniref:AraC family transcriptional regulator n=1 Tax=Paenibacillus sp. LHD-117 TaxID=3071412 RepID=UPI0027E11F11|nr:GyrI-like domain-containing protein [Paenibacillus sp. LHD-117]MDQ6418862.1 GyrI-like domain-containing protein [Paenibacillus sp. LHD-117]